MNIIKVSGTAAKKELAEAIQAGLEDAWLLALERGDEEEEPATGEQMEEWLLESGLVDEAPVVIDSNEPFVGLGTCFRVFITDAPLEALDLPVRSAAKGAELVLVEWGPAFASDDEAGLESQMKEQTGAAKVLVYRDDEGRERAFGKAADMALASSGPQPERDLPAELIAALEDEALEGRLDCETAHRIGRELEVPLAEVGRALDLLHIKISRCQLGCF